MLNESVSTKHNADWELGPIFAALTSPVYDPPPPPLELLEEESSALFSKTAAGNQTKKESSENGGHGRCYTWRFGYI